MLTKEIISHVQSIPAGGLVTDEARIEPLLALYLYNTTRVAMISAQFQKGIGIADNLYSRTFINIDRCDKSEDGCVLRYKIPEPPVDIDGYGLAIGYVGPGGKTRSYYRIPSRSFLANASNLQKAVYSNNVGYLYDNMFQQLELHYAKGIKPVNVEMEYIALDPTKLPEFNIEKDAYPVSGSLHRMIMDYIRTADMSVVFGRPRDKVSNSTEDNPQSEQK